MTLRLLQFITVIVVAVALFPSASHLASLPNKVSLPQQDYFVVQAAYRSWAYLGVLWPLALILNVAVAIAVRHQSVPFWLCLGSAACFGVMLAVYALWTQPANSMTSNWTMVPENWRALRFQWEYSHAANASIGLIALCMTTWSSLGWKPDC